METQIKKRIALETLCIIAVIIFMTLLSIAFFPAQADSFLELIKMFLALFPIPTAGAVSALAT